VCFQKALTSNYSASYEGRNPEGVQISLFIVVENRLGQLPVSSYKLRLLAAVTSVLFQIPLLRCLDAAYKKKIEHIYKRIQKNLNLYFISDAFPFKTFTRFPQPVGWLGGRGLPVNRGLIPSTVKRLSFVVSHFFNSI